MGKISLKLRQDCKALFKQCPDVFSSPEKLRVFASVTELKLIVEYIPDSEQLNHDKLISDLVEHGRSPSEPALLDLLNALAFKYQEEEWKAQPFRDLSALLQAENSEPEQDFHQLNEESAPRDGRGADAAARWINEVGDDLDELALRVTLAVFNGTAFEVIEDAKKELFEMLKPLVPPPPPPDPENPPPPAPHVPLMRRLEKAGARETEGKPPDWQRVVELERPEVADEALIYVWQQRRETEWRQEIIKWLTNHAAGRHEADVRRHAAVAVGRLAVKDYRFVRDKLLNSWARKYDPQFRTAVGMALSVPVREESMAEEVQGLLREWAESDVRAKRWAAMRAYIYVGPYCRPAGEAIARWRELADSERIAVKIQISENEVLRLNNPLHMSLMDAMEKFFLNAAYLSEGERRPLFVGILEELEAWASSEEETAWLGVFMFTRLGQLRVGVGEDGEAGGAPVLLQLMGEGADEAGYRARLGRVFEAAMRNGATIIETQELLCSWLGWVDGLQDDSPEYEGRMLTLFKEIMAADGGGRMRGKLVACLRDCGRNRAAQRLLAAL